MIKFRHFAFLAGGLALSMYAFAWAVTGLPGFSTFPAAVTKGFLAWGMLIGLIYFGLDIDTRAEWERIKKNPVATAIIILAFAILLAPSVASGQACPAQEISQRPALVDSAMKEVGATEQPPQSNEGERVESYLASVGLSGGYPWCAAYVRWAMDEARTNTPDVRSAGATDYITRRSIDATDVLRGTEEVDAGALAIWRRGDTWKGHIGIVRSWQQRCGATVEGNTSPGEAGPQRDGDGVWPRNRCIRPGSYFRIVAFTPTS